jgi:flagellar protein FlbD
MIRGGDDLALAAGVYSAVAGAFFFRSDSRVGDLQMIALTRLNGQSFVINADKIRYVESTPDTVICCDHGEKMMVKESLHEVMRKAIDYARVIRKAVTE